MSDQSRTSMSTNNVVPYYEDEWVTLYHGDARDIVPLLGPVDVVLADPPYGIDGGKGTLSKARARGDYQAAFTDDEAYIEQTVVPLIVDLIRAVPCVVVYDLLPDHIRQNFTPGDPAECWIYAKRSTNGYAMNTSVNNYKANAYRLIYLMMVGPIPAGHDLDHTCDNGPGGCVNWHHLTPCLHRANVLRSAETVPGKHIRKTHCPSGHPYDEENTYWYGPNKEWRRCRICNHRDQVRARTLHGDRYRESQRRYEQSDKGKAKKAERQKRYRERRAS